MHLTLLLRNYCFFGFFPLTPLIVATAPLFLPYILRRKTPRNAAGHGKGEGRMLSCCVESSSDCNKS